LVCNGACHAGVPCRFASRLTGIKENAKLEEDEGERRRRAASANAGAEAAGGGGEARARRQVRVRVPRHGGYWGGVKLAVEGMEHYENALAYPVPSPSVMDNQPDIVMDSLSVLGLGWLQQRRGYSRDKIDFYRSS
jgi:raffinose synthase